MLNCFGGCHMQDDEDPNTAAYIAYSSENNMTMHIDRLTSDFKDVSSRDPCRAFVQQQREAPAFFKHKGLFFMATSGCSGWKPNRLKVFWSRCVTLVVLLGSVYAYLSTFRTHAGHIMRSACENKLLCDSSILQVTARHSQIDVPLLNHNLLKEPFLLCRFYAKAFRLPCEVMSIYHC